jgi:hypothetical protein
MTKKMRMACVIQNIQEWQYQTTPNTRYLKNTFFDMILKKNQKIPKNLEKSCDQISARITMPNVAKLKIFAKY